MGYIEAVEQMRLNKHLNQGVQKKKVMQHNLTERCGKSRAIKMYCITNSGMLEDENSNMSKETLYSTGGAEMCW